MDRRGLLVVVLLVALVGVALLMQAPEREEIAWDEAGGLAAEEAAPPQLATAFAGRGTAGRGAAGRDRPPAGAPGMDGDPWAVSGPPGTGRIAGRVVDRKGRPVAGFGVLVRDGGPTTGSRVVVTDGEGGFAVAGLGAARVQVRGLGVAATEVEVGRMDLVLVQAYHLVERRIEIVREDGRTPLTGSLGLCLMRQGSAWDFTTVAIKEGGALLHLPSDAHRAVVLPQAARDAQGDLGLLGSPVELDLASTGPLRLVLAEGATIRGRVQTESGEGAGRVPLSATPAGHPGEGLPTPSPTVVSEEDGAFRFTGLAQGTYELGVVGEHLARVSMDALSVAAGTEDVVLVVRGARTLEGWVVDDRGRPLVGATVKATGDTGRGRVRGPRSARSMAPDGAFRLEGLPPTGRFDVWVEALEAGDDAWLASPAQTVEDSRSPLTISLARGALLAGRFEPARGALAHSARLELFTVPGEGRPRLSGMASPRADGTFSLGPVAAGDYDLHARLDAYGGQAIVQRVRLPADDVVVELDLERVVWGRVEGAGAGVEIALRGEGATSTTTGRDGRFFLPRPAGDDLVLLARDAASGRQALLRGLPAEGKDLVIELVPGARLAGSFAAVEDSQRIYGGRLVARQGALLVEGRVDPEASTWRFDGLPPGRWSVEFHVYLGRRWVRFAADDLAAGQTGIVLPIVEDPAQGGPPRIDPFR